jgi:uncharacterized phage-associated protein
MNFNYKKATQMLDYFAIKQGGKINRMKALKLIYFADRYHLRKYNRLITNDTYFAMDNGPVASGSKDIAYANEVIGRIEQSYASCFIEVCPPYELKSKDSPDLGVLSKSDIEAMEFAWNKFGGLDEWNIVTETHKYPDWYKHKDALEIFSRIEMDLEDLLTDPKDNGVDKCFELSAKDKEARGEYLKEISKIESLWR